MGRVKNSSKLIDHLDDAKVWLDKAKEEYIQSNPVNGELNLNLAQAEVKLAWELSHQHFVSNSHKVTPTRKLNYFIPVAASFLLILGLLSLFQLNNPKRLAANQRDSQKIVADRAIVAQRAEQTETDLTLKVQPAKPVVDNSTSDEKVINQANQETVALNTITEPAEPTPAELSRERNPSEVDQNSLRLRRAAQIQIDEEALTREASHSLRNGK